MTPGTIDKRRCKHAVSNCTVQQCDGWFIVKCERCSHTFNGEGLVVDLFGKVERRCPIWAWKALAQLERSRRSNDA